ncbi:MAG: hypothetical protein ACTHMP_18565 [Thermomicrobiales bacterium]
MSQGRLLAIAFIVVGALLALVSAFADQIGLGAPHSTFGWKQLLGVVLGIIILVAGIILLRQDGVEYEDETEADLAREEIAESDTTDSEHQA